MTSRSSMGRLICESGVVTIALALGLTILLPTPLLPTPLSATPATDSPATRLYFPLLLHSRVQVMERSAQLGGTTWVVRLVGHYAFIGIGQQLQVLDVTDMARPQVLAHSNLNELIGDIVVRGGRVYVQCGVMTSIYGWDGTTLQVLGRIQHYGLMAVAGDTVFFVTTSGLAVFDVRDPARLSQVGFVELPAIYSSGADSPCGLAVAGGSAYVSYNQVTLTVDVRDTAHPAILGSSHALSVCPMTTFDGGLIGLRYGADGRSLAVVDPSDPAQWSWTTTDVCGGQDPEDVAVQGRTALVLCGGSPAAVELYHFELGPSRPAQLARLPLGLSDGWGPPRSAAMDGSRMAAVSGGAQLTLVDGSDPRAPRVTYRDETYGIATAVAARGDGAWMAMLSDGYAATTELSWLDLSHPTPRWPGVTVRLAGVVKVLAIVGDQLVAAGTSATGPFLALVARRGSVWREVQRLELHGPPGELLALGNYVAVRQGTESAQIFRVSPLVGLVPGSIVPVPGSVRAMAADGGFLLLNGGLPNSSFSESYVALVDVADPERPVLRSWRMAGLPSHIEGMAAGGGRVYLGYSWPSTLKVLDASDPTNLSVVATSRPVGASLTPRAVVGRLLLVDSPLRVVDVSDPSWPQPWSTDGPDMSGATGLVVAGRWLLVAEGPRGLTLVHWPVQP